MPVPERNHLTEGEVELIAAAVRQICRITGLVVPVGIGDLHAIEMLIRARSATVAIPGPVRSLCYPEQFFLSDRPTRNAALRDHAHAICHMLLHVGETMPYYLCIEGAATGWKARAEAHAELFADLLLAEPELQA